MTAELVSIALCTYNGAAYLKEQLDTLINQTYPNCEIIIVDDCSKDNTVEILKQYAESHHQIKLYINSENLGYTKNFEKAIGLCNGEYIALCDQDDIWDKNKISIMLEHIGNNILAYHDSAFIDEKGNPLNKKISDVQNCYSGNDSRIFLFGNCVLGHATLFKRELLKFTGNFNDTVIHDRWLAYVATNNGSIVFIEQALVQYRQHFNANTNILKQERVNTSKSNSIEKMKFERDVMTIFVNYPYNADLDFKKKLLKLMQDRMQSYTSFTLAYFIFKHRSVLLYIQKKSAISKINKILKYIWGYKIKTLSLFNVKS
jgi:glycosyltransferase involved in cell wall biosynthesis